MMIEMCCQYQIAMNLRKCIFCAPFGVLLGHVVCHNRILVGPTKVPIILDLPPPTSVTQLKSHIGNTSYYMKLIKGYEEIIVPMEKLLKKYAKF